MARYFETFRIAVEAIKVTHEFVAYPDSWPHWFSNPPQGITKPRVIEGVLHVPTSWGRVPVKVGHFIVKGDGSLNRYRVVPSDDFEKRFGVG